MACEQRHSDRRGAVPGEAQTGRVTGEAHLAAKPKTAVEQGSKVAVDKVTWLYIG